MVFTDISSTPLFLELGILKYVKQKYILIYFSLFHFLKCIGFLSRIVHFKVFPGTLFRIADFEKKRQLTDIFKKVYDLSSVAEVFFLDLSLNQGFIFFHKINVNLS